MGARLVKSEFTNRKICIHKPISNITTILKMDDTIITKKVIGRPPTSGLYKKYNDNKKVIKLIEKEIEMERQEKVARIDAIRKSIVGFIIEKSESGEPVIFSNN